LDLDSWYWESRIIKWENQPWNDLYTSFKKTKRRKVKFSIIKKKKEEEEISLLEIS
jgi:hypothetical protein